MNNLRGQLLFEVCDGLSRGHGYIHIYISLSIYIYLSICTYTHICMYVSIYI